MPYVRYPCPASDGWQERISSKLIYATAGGSVAGVVSAVINSRPLVVYTLATSASCFGAMGVFAVLQEGVRFIRCSDSAVNSFLAGSLTGYGITGLQLGKQRGVLGGLLTGTVAVGCHDFSTKYDPHLLLKKTLIRLDLMDRPDDLPPDPPRERFMSEEEYDRVGLFGVRWNHYKLFRKVTKAEYDHYKEQQARNMEMRMKASEMVRKEHEDGV